MKWIPLEANPEVFNEWAEHAGLVISQDQFYDVIGLEPELLAMIPQPVKAILLLFPARGDIEKNRIAVDEKIAKDGQHEVDPTLLFITQTISNACGTIGLLHALLNTSTTTRPESPLAKFSVACQELSPDDRGKLLETTDLFSAIHASAAAQGQTAAPDINADTDLHFACFVESLSNVPGETGKRLVELDGRRGGPVDHGPSVNFLEDVSKIIRKNFMDLLPNELNFTMVALASTLPNFEEFQD